MKEIVNVFKVGDSIPSFDVDGNTNISAQAKKILEIHDIPKSDEEASKLIDDIFDRYFSEGNYSVSVIPGDNWAHNKNLEPYIEQDKVYVLGIKILIIPKLLLSDRRSKWF